MTASVFSSKPTAFLILSISPIASASHTAAIRVSAILNMLFT